MTLKEFLAIIDDSEKDMKSKGKFSDKTTLGEVLNWASEQMKTNDKNGHNISKEK